MADTITGFNWENTVVENTPFMVAEIRMFVASFIIDKQVATLIGRPPRLSRRYASVKLPLDLSDNEIMLKGDELQEKISKLDADGWNTIGKVTRSACIRAMTVAALSRDEILELSLGCHSLCEPKQLFQYVSTIFPTVEAHSFPDVRGANPKRLSNHYLHSCDITTRWIYLVLSLYRSPV